MGDQIKDCDTSGEKTWIILTQDVVKYPPPGSPTCFSYTYQEKKSTTNLKFHSFSTLDSRCSPKKLDFYSNSQNDINKKFELFKMVAFFTQAMWSSPKREIV